MEENKKQTTINDVFEVVSFIKNNAVTKTEFGELKTEFGELKTEFGELKTEFGEFKENVNVRFNEVNFELDSIKSQMVTKAYLDDKLADLGSEIIARVDRRFERDNGFHRELLEALKHHSLLDAVEVKKLEELIK